MGNSFLQMFMRSAPAVLKTVQGFGAKAAPKAARQVVDTVTNPQTYRGLASKAENVLQRGLPKSFAGSNFGNIPARFTGLISDVAGMPAGIQRSAQAGMVNRAIQEAAGAVPQLARSAQQYATGALRAPVIGDAVQTARQVTSGVQGALMSPTGFGGPFMRDPALRREFLKQFGGTSEKAARALSGGGGTNFGQIGSLLRNLASPSAAFGAIPGSTLAKTVGAGLLGGGTSIAGSVANLAFLGGSTPQGEDSYDRWQQLGYSSKDDMKRQVMLQAQVEGNRGNTVQFGPEFPSGLMDRSAVVPPGSAAPPAPTLPPPSGGFTGSSYGGQQTGRQAAPAMVPQGLGVMSNGAGVPALRQNVQERALSQEVLNAAQQYSSPSSVSLPSFYQGQQQLGRSMEQTGELQRQLQELGGAAGMSNDALMQWAQANPGLAYRELQKLKSRSGQ